MAKKAISILIRFVLNFIYSYCSVVFIMGLMVLFLFHNHSFVFWREFQVPYVDFLSEQKKMILFFNKLTISISLTVSCVFAIYHCIPEKYTKENYSKFKNE